MHAGLHQSGTRLPRCTASSPHSKRSEGYLRCSCCRLRVMTGVVVGAINRLKHHLMHLRANILRTAGSTQVGGQWGGAAQVHASAVHGTMRHGVRRAGGRQPWRSCCAPLCISPHSSRHRGLASCMCGTHSPPRCARWRRRCRRCCCCPPPVWCVMSETTLQRRGRGCRSLERATPRRSPQHARRRCLHCCTHQPSGTPHSALHRWGPCSRTRPTRPAPPCGTHLSPRAALCAPQSRAAPLPAQQAPCLPCPAQQPAPPAPAARP